MTDRLAEKLHWFLARLDHPPMQLHLHSVWVDLDDGAGSALGSPALSHAWRSWLAAASGMVTVQDMAPCFHVGTPEGEICRVCAIRDADGQPIAQSGFRNYEREVYRWPMRAAMAHVGGNPPPGRPGLTLTLVTLARAGGNPVSAAETLARRWPKMGDPRVARGHFLFALDRVREIWPEYDQG